METQLRDLGLMSSPLCLSLLTREMRTQRNLAGRAPSPSEPSAKGAELMLSAGGAPTPCPGPKRLAVRGLHH